MLTSVDLIHEGCMSAGGNEGNEFKALTKCDPMRENQPNYPKAFLSVGSFKDKKGNNSKSPEHIFLKFCGIVLEYKCQLFMWSVNFSAAKKSIKSSNEDGGNFVNKNWCVQKIS